MEKNNFYKSIFKLALTMRETKYTTYEEPLKGQSFTYNQIQEVYRDFADKEEYPDFDCWLSDMLKSGVFEKEI